MSAITVQIFKASNQMIVSIVQLVGVVYRFWNSMVKEGGTHDASDQ